MGLWQWLLSKLLEPPAGQTKATSARRGATAGAACAGGGSATAVMERPEDASAADHAYDDAEPWWAQADATLTELAPVPEPPLSTEARALQNTLVNYLDGHDLSLPPLPRVPEKVLNRLRSRKFSMRDIATDITEDQVIAATVLRMANSPLYRGMDKITGLEPAVIRLGNNAIRTLMLHQSLRALSFHKKKGNSRFAEMLWERARASAYINHGLSKLTRMNSDHAFLAGLLHDIGNVIVLRTSNEQRAIAGYDISETDFEYLCFESHQEFGELIAESWQMPDDLKSLISNHHQYPDADDPQRAERLQLQVSDMIGALLAFSPWQPYDLLNARAVKDLGLDENPDFVEYLAQLPDELDELLASF